ncbi:MAG: Alpha/beta hydrolase [Massilia sp.]|nr:Alpha/beta hydrolase [Massilia sp.]
MFPSVTFPTRRPTNWRTPALLAVAGLAASFLYVQAKKAAVERDYPPGGKFVDVGAQAGRRFDWQLHRNKQRGPTRRGRTPDVHWPIKN